MGTLETSSSEQRGPGHPEGVLGSSSRKEPGPLFLLVRESVGVFFGSGIWRIPEQIRTGHSHRLAWGRAQKSPHSHREHNRHTSPLHGR
jgi:hypothetical protein